MKRPRKHWRLVATPALPGDETSVALATACNNDQRRFWTRRGAEQAKYFYEQQLAFPVKFWVVDADHMMENRTDAEDSS